jgi:hypothetical protein
MVWLFQRRKQLPALRNGDMKRVDSGNPHLFAYRRQNGDQHLRISNNISEFEQVMRADELAAAGMTHNAEDIVTQQILTRGSDLTLEGYRYAWLDLSAPPRALYEGMKLVRRLRRPTR